MLTHFNDNTLVGITTCIGIYSYKRLKAYVSSSENFLPRWLPSNHTGKILKRTVIIAIVVGLQMETYLSIVICERSTVNIMLLFYISILTPSHSCCHGDTAFDGINCIQESNSFYI